MSSNMPGLPSLRADEVAELVQEDVLAQVCGFVCIKAGQPNRLPRAFFGLRDISSNTITNSLVDSLSPPKTV